MSENLQDREEDGKLPGDVVQGACRSNSHAKEAPGAASATEPVMDLR